MWLTFQRNYTQTKSTLTHSTHSYALKACAISLPGIILSPQKTLNTTSLSIWDWAKGKPTKNGARAAEESKIKRFLLHASTLPTYTKLEHGSVTGKIFTAFHRFNQTEDFPLSFKTANSTYPPGWQLSRQKITTVGEDVGKLELLGPVSGTVKWHSSTEDSMEVPPQIKNRTNRWYSNSTLGYMPNKIEIRISKILYTKFIISSTIHSSKEWKKPKYPSSLCIQQTIFQPWKGRKSSHNMADPGGALP